MSSDRKVSRDDYFLIKHVLTKHHKRLLRSNAKAWYKYIDLDACMKYFYECENAYVVDDAYMVIYEIVQPFYMKDGHTMLQEVIVLRLVGGSDFSAVPAFLERKRVEAGALLSAVGTALARNDAALASLYQSFGYKTETHLLIKEP